MNRTTLFALVAALLAPMIANAGTLEKKFSFQGRISSGGLPVTGSLPMTFSIWDSPFAGNQIGSSLVFAGIPIEKGVFTTQLDFGVDIYTGSPRWLDIVVNGQALTPRQLITGVPYAIQTRGMFVDQAHNVSMDATVPTTSKLHVETATHTEAIVAMNNNTSGFASAIYGESNNNINGTGVYGRVKNATGLTNGVRGDSWSASGRGVWGRATSATGTNYGVYGQNSSVDGAAIFGLANNADGTAISGQAAGANGYAGYFVGRGYCSGNVGIGTPPSPSFQLFVSSALNQTIRTESNASSG
ncbi:MAG: hypothetical protein KDA20_11850, partial [Phycisphaerales bacterium]|nr:hypothetical protein [Phycisphaerales bacterium]